MGQKRSRMRPAGRHIIPKFRRGFTLVEILIGMSIFSLLALTLYTVFHNGIRIQEQADRVESLYGEIRWALDQIGQDMENMAPFIQGDTKKNIFQITEDRLRLVVPTQSGLDVVEYALIAPETARIHKIIVNQAQAKNKNIVVNSTRVSSAKLLVRTAQPLAEFLEQDAKDDASVGKLGQGSEVLGPLVEADGLKFFVATRDSESDDTKIEWKHEWDIPQFPLALRVEIVFINPEDAQKPFRVQKDILIPSGMVK